MTVDEYIKSKEKFRLMPFVTIYTAIMELINDGYIRRDLRGMRDGYSRDDGEAYMMEQLEGMMDDAEKPSEKEALRRCMEALKRE